MATGLFYTVLWWEGHKMHYNFLS